MDRIYARGFRCRSHRGAARRRLGAHVRPPAAGRRARARLSAGRRPWRARRSRPRRRPRGAASGPRARAAEGRRGAVRGAGRGDRRGPRRGAARDLHLRVRRRAAPRRRGARARRGARRQGARRRRRLRHRRRAGRVAARAGRRPACSWRVFNPARGWRVLLPRRWRRLHRKLCVVDGQVAFCGGINLLDDYHDPTYGKLDAAALRFRGARDRPAGRRRARDDDAAVAAHAGHARGAPARSRRGARRRVRAAARRHRRATMRTCARRTSTPRAAAAPRRRHARRPGAARQPALPQAHRALLPLRDRRRRSARSSSPTPTSFPACALQRALLRAAERGVKVHAAAAGHATSTSCSTTPAGRCTACCSTRASRSSSTRRASCTPRWRCSTARRAAIATVGSSNLDPLSLLLAREANVFVRDDAFAAELRGHLLEAVRTTGQRIDVGAASRHRPLRHASCEGCRTRLACGWHCALQGRSASSRPAHRSLTMQSDLVVAAPARACTARRATSTSTRGGRWSAPSSRMRTPTMRAAATATTSPRRRPRRAAHAARRRIDLQTLPYGEAIDHSRRAPQPASGRPRARLGAGAARARRAGLGRVGRLLRRRRSADRARTTPPARRSSRCAATASSPNRPSACRSTAGAPQAEVFAAIDAWWRAQRRGRPREPAPRLQLRQGAAHPGRASTARSDRSSCTARSSRSTAPTAPPASTLPATPLVDRDRGQGDLLRARLVVAPPSAQGSPWTRRFGEYSDAFASGWMQLRGARRRRGGRPRLRAQRPRRLAGPAARDRRHRRRARDRHPRLRGGDGALARASRGCEARAPSPPSTATTTTRSDRRTPSRRGEGVDMKRFAAPLRRARREHRDARQGRRAAALLRRRPRRATPPGRCTSSPAASRARSCRPACCARLACRRAGIDDWLFDACYQAVGDFAETVAHVLPPPAQRAATSAWPNGSRSGCCRCAACAPEEQAARVASVLGRARHAPGASCSTS